MRIQKKMEGKIEVQLWSRAFTIDDKEASTEENMDFNNKLKGFTLVLLKN
jgi:hypothetical protein